MIPNRRAGNVVSRGNVVCSYWMHRYDDSTSSSSCAIAVGAMYRWSVVTVVHSVASMMVGTTAVVSSSSS